MPFTPRILVSLGVLPFVPALHADWKDDIGATRLTVTFPNVPTSVGIVTQAEAGDTDGNFYLPDSANAVFAGKNIVNQSPGTGLSGHATTVGGLLYGSPGSLLPGTTTIHAYNASYWIESDFLRFGTNSAPLVEAAKVQNHSWIATGSDLTEAQIANIDQRLDFAINRDGFVCVAGVNNGQSTTLPLLLAQAYNHLTVGLTYGGHSAGFTTNDGVGRIKPDLVAPDVLTSFATPKVAGAAGVLAARAMASPHALTGGNVPRVVKALLLAGATKEEFSAWARTTERPLDLRFGAGELNLLLAYRILESGRATASAAMRVPEIGWAAETVGNGGQKTYFFEIPAGAAPAPFSVALTWHRLVNNGSFGPFWSASPVALANLGLQLRAASGFTVGELLDESASAVDNVEHIYAPALAAGRYALVVTTPAGAANTTYALAWRATPSVAVTATTPEARELDGAAGIFTLTRTGSTATPLLVPLTRSGSALTGSHYVTLPASVIIPAGAASVTVSVTPVSDMIAQGDRTVVLAVAGDYSLAAAAPAGATVTLRDKPFDAWRFARFTTEQLASAEISGDAADPDADGLGNLLEYALAAEPLTPDSSLFAPQIGLESDAPDARLTLAFIQPAERPDLAYAAEWTNDLLAAWQSGEPVVTEISRTPVAGGERVVFRAAAPLSEQPRQFLRLRVERL